MQVREIVDPQGQVLRRVLDSSLATSVRRVFGGAPKDPRPLWKRTKKEKRSPRVPVRCNICGYPVGWKGMTPAIKVGEHTNGRSIYVHAGCAERISTRTNVLDALGVGG